MSSKFLIQKNFENSPDITYDFIYELLNALKFYDWKTNFKSDFCYTLEEKIGLIPIGSLEFTLSYYRKYHNIELYPKNIPYELYKNKEFTKRNVYNIAKTDIDIPSKEMSFIKSNLIFKYYQNGIHQIKDLDPGRYQISDIVDFISEYRCFVYDRKLVGLSHYMGDFTIFPDIQLINQMIREYKTAPISYTLDVGIIKDKGTAVIECHDFFSSSNYGWRDYSLIPVMFSRWYYDVIINKGITI